MLAAVLVGVFAIFDGHAHGAELPPGWRGLLYPPGLRGRDGCLHAVGIDIGMLQRWPSERVACRVSRVALRAAGGAIGTAGLLFMQHPLQ